MFSHGSLWVPTLTDDRKVPAGLGASRRYHTSDAAASSTRRIINLTCFSIMARHNGKRVRYRLSAMQNAGLLERTCLLPRAESHPGYGRARRVRAFLASTLYA